MKAEISKLKTRNIVTVDKTTGIIKNGADNAYPTRIERLINASVTAKSCAEMYASFLVGNGFENVELNKIIVSRNLYREITLYDLLEKFALSLAYQSGLFCRTGYSAIPKNTAKINDLTLDDFDFKINSLNFFHYKNCRFGKPDDENYSGKILYYENFDKSKNATIKHSDFKEFNIFNPNQDVIKHQIANSKSKGDITKWSGQVAPMFLNDDYIYPISMFDVAQDDMDTENQISLFKNGELSRNFFAKYFLKHAKFANDHQKQKFVDTIRESMGAENNGGMIVTSGDITTDGNNQIIDDTFKLEKIEQNINDKLFVEWEKSTSNNIRKSAKGLPDLLINPSEGLFSASGEAFKSAAKFYNEMTKKDRQKISNFLKEIFKNWKTPILDDFKISELKFGTEINSIDEITKQKLTAQANLKGSVGGVTALLALQQSVAAKTTDINSGVAIIQEIFGINENTARKMLGSPEITPNTL